MKEFFSEIFKNGLPFIHIGVFLLVYVVIAILIAKSKELKEFLTDDSKKLSLGRLLCFLLVISYIFYAGYLVVTKGILTDLPATIFALVGALYGINKFSPTLPFEGSKPQ